MYLTGPLRAEAFAARLDPLGPFEPRPHLAVAVSGGADSMALAILASDWAAERGGRMTAFVVDHGLRDASADEAATTRTRLADRMILARVLSLRLARGPRMAERARRARHDVLEQACVEAGLLHLLFGHHAADQAETVAMRRLRGSSPLGLAGMAALRETDQIRLLRPLLDVPPVVLRETLMAAKVEWIEDPSNADSAAERVRLRHLARDRDGAGPLIRAAVDAAAARGLKRVRAEQATAEWLGRCVAIFPSGHAVVADAAMPADALTALLMTIGGREYPPPVRQVTAWLASPRSATLAGVQIVQRRQDWLFVRESAAISNGPGRCWDGRFLMVPDLEMAQVPKALPALVKRAMPQLRAADGSAMVAGRFAPIRPLTRGAFVPSKPGMQKPPPHPI